MSKTILITKSTIMTCSSFLYILHKRKLLILFCLGESGRALPTKKCCEGILLTSVKFWRNEFKVIRVRATSSKFLVSRSLFGRYSTKQRIEKFDKRTAQSPPCKVRWNTGFNGPSKCCSSRNAFYQLKELRSTRGTKCKSKETGYWILGEYWNFLWMFDVFPRNREFQ